MGFYESTNIYWWDCKQQITTSEWITPMYCTTQNIRHSI